jgi:hypothetical protein
MQTPTLAANRSGSAMPSSTGAFTFNSRRSAIRALPSTCFGEDHQEFIRPQARDMVGRAQHGLNSPGELGQDAVPDGVAASLIDLLEVVAVEQYGHRVRAGPPGAPELRLERLPQPPSAQRLRQGVNGDDAAEMLPDCLKFSQRPALGLPRAVTLVAKRLKLRAVGAGVDRLPWHPAAFVVETIVRRPRGRPITDQRALLR